ncbi:MAG: polymer-forming cytoskeletal protein [Candidatus Omnitrophota bacterium]
MKKRKGESNDQYGDKMLDVSASMQGTLRFEDPVNLRINGKFEGTLDTKGVLMIGHKADIAANIVGEEILISGRVLGNIKAGKSLRLESSASLKGDVETPILSIGEGAVINGRIKMTGFTGEENISKRDNWLDTNQLAEYLEVDRNKVGEWASDGVLPGTKEGGQWIFERSKIDQWIADGKVKTKG